jgi:hypothetical protein
MGLGMNKIFVFLCVIWVLCPNQSFGVKLGAGPVKRVVSFELKEQPLKLVVEEIHKQTGCRVVFDEKWNELLLNGQYVGVTLEEFFMRALRKQNVSLSYNDKENVVALRFFGDRGIGKKTIASTSENNSKAHLDGDIKVLHELQHQELQAYLKDPEAVDPVSGMKLVDIQKMHVDQKLELEQLMNHPETIDPVSGMKLADIQKLQGAQSAEWEHLRNNPKAIDPESGMTISEIKQIHDIQHVELVELKKNPPNDEAE